LFLSKKEKLNTSSIGEIASIKAGGDCPDDFSLIPTKDCFIPIYSNGTVNEGLYGYTSRAIIKGRSITIAARGTIGFCVRRYGEYAPIIRLLSVCPFELGADTYLHQIISRMTFKKNGSVQQQLTVPELSAIRIPYPSKEDLLENDTITYPLILQINCNKKENDQLCMLRDELLPLLMNGQVEVKQLNSNLSNRQIDNRFSRPSRRCHGFCKALALTLPPQCCSAMLPFKKLPLRSSCQLFARQ
jgi:type I restriction enzyme S subunit